MTIDPLAKDLPIPAGTAAVAPKAKWLLWGAAAGILGTAANLIANPQIALTGEQAKTGTGVFQALERAGYHVAAAAGFLAVVCLIITSAAWARWAERSLRSDLAARMVPIGLVASAGAMILAYGVMGALSVYLPAGSEAGRFPQEALYALVVVADLAPFIAWQGVAVAAAAMSWLAVTSAVRPRWVGAVCAVGAFAPLVTLLATGSPGLAGVTGPITMTVAFTAMALSGTCTVDEEGPVTRSPTGLNQTTQSHKEDQP